MRTFLIFLFVAIVSLIVYNPEMDDFKAYVETVELKQQMDQRTSITQMFTQDSVRTRRSKATTSTERNNFLIFSSYKISLMDEAQMVEPVVNRYLGIAGMFFELGQSSHGEALAAQP